MIIYQTNGGRKKVGIGKKIEVSVQTPWFQLGRKDCYFSSKFMSEQNLVCNNLISLLLIISSFLIIREVEKVDQLS